MPPRKVSFVKKFAIISACLILIEGMYLYLFSRAAGPGPKEAIASALKKASLDDRRREQMKIQLALSLYQSGNKGTLPGTLNELVPNYLDSIPIDPATKKPFDYKVVNGRAFVGDNGGKKPILAANESEVMTAALLDSEANDEKARFVYDSTGKRDPFRPFDFSPPVDKGRTELEKYDIGQLKLTAVLGGIDQPTALVQNSAGRGFTIRKGTKIGLHGGEVIEIQPSKILILETSVDFTGEKKTQTFEMRLRTKDQEERRN